MGENVVVLGDQGESGELAGEKGKRKGLAGVPCYSTRWEEVPWRERSCTLEMPSAPSDLVASNQYHYMY